MKTLSLAALLVSAALLAAAPPAPAQTKLYTWTDARGNLHITDEPPPQQTRLQDVVESPEQTPEEMLQQQEGRLRRAEARREGERRGELEETMRRAREADEEARAAILRAEEQIQRAMDYRKKFGNTAERREQFKYKIRAEEEKAAAAQAEAQQAVMRAKAAAEEARRAAAARP
jgi:hypothetical protein